MPTEAQLQSALKAGYTPQQIKLALARAGQTDKKPSGLAKAGEFAMDVLNTPSYLAGGALKGIREGGVGGFLMGSGLKGALSGVKQGFTGKEAPTVFSELPKTLGMKEGSVGSTLVGLGGELLTPGVGIGKALNYGGKALGITGKSLKVGGKVGSITNDMARTLLEKSYKLNKTNIDKIADVIGVTDESQKSIKVIDFLEGLKLKGTNRTSLGILNQRIDAVQKPFNKLVKTDKIVSRSPYVNKILDEAVKQEALNTPESISLSKRLVEEAYRQEKLSSKSLTDTDLSKTIKQLWSDVAEKEISDPNASSLAKSLANAGSEARETFAPGSRDLGTKLRRLITVQKEIGKQANTGLGTQLINAVKPSGIGFLAGAGIGQARGENPLMSGIVGAGIGIGLNNPRVLNTMGKFLQGSKLPSLPSSVGKVAERVAGTAIRSPGFMTAGQSERIQPQITQPQPYNSTIPQMDNPTFISPEVKTKNLNPPSNVFKNKSSFGKVKKLKVGSFN